MKSLLYAINFTTSSNTQKTHGHLQVYTRGLDYGSFRANVLGHATGRKEWHFLFVRAPLHLSDAHLAACQVTSLNLRTTALLKGPLLNSVGMIIAIPFGVPSSPNRSRSCSIGRTTSLSTSRAS